MLPGICCLLCVVVRGFYDVVVGVVRVVVVWLSAKVDASAEQCVGTLRPQTSYGKGKLEWPGLRLDALGSRGARCAGGTFFGRCTPFARGARGAVGVPGARGARAL